MSHDEMIAVIRAHKEGKAIQCRYRECNIAGGEWLSFDIGGCPAWNFHEFDYRVKPEPPKPRELYVYENERGSLAGYPLTKNKPKNDSTRRGRYVRFVEDLSQ